MATDGVYTDLRDLIRTQWAARGFNLLPRQLLHSALAAGARHAYAAAG